MSHSSEQRAPRNRRTTPRDDGDLFRSLVENALDAVISIDGSGQVVEWNGRAADMFGWQRDEAVGRSLAELIIPPEQRAAHEQGLARYLETGDGPILRQRIELTAIDRDGARLPVEITVCDVKHGDQMRFHAFVRDLRGREQAAALVRQHDQFVRSILDSLPSNVAVIDGQGTIRTVNNRWRQFCRENQGDEKRVDVGADYLAVCDACLGNDQALAQRAAEGIRSVLDGEEKTFSLEYPCNSPTAQRWYLMQVAPLRESDSGAVISHLDITARKLAEQRRAELSAIVESTDDAVIGKKLDGTIVSWNRGAERLYGYTADEAIGQNIQMLVPSYLRDELQRIYDSIYAGRPVEHFQTQRVRKDGSEITVWLTISPIKDEFGNLRGASAIARNITDLIQAQRVKADFLANVSHELRTPMNVIIGMTDLALREQLPADARDYLQTARESADALLHLVNEILDFSKMEAGKFELDKTSFDLRATIDETLKAHSLRASEKGLELMCDVPPEVPERLVGDPRRLRQIISNLISNALKFTTEGEVTLRIGAESETSDEIVLHFVVADTGIGISEEDQRYIFAPFTQADTSTTRVFGGTGLGLAIASELAAMMGGNMWVESRIGRGSKFHFTARFAREAGDVVRPLSAEALRDVPILVVDDNASNRKILVEMVRTWSMRPTAVSSGGEALEEMRRAAAVGQPYPLVLLDVLMPGTDGFTVVERAQHEPRLATATILMISSAHRSDFHQRARHLNVCAYLEKPVARGELLRVLLSALAGEPIDADAQVPIARARKRMKILIVEDTPANQKVVRAILTKRGHGVTVAGDGAAAVGWFRREPFDAILMDVQMPGMDGFAAARQMRSIEGQTQRRVPIIAMTAHAMRGDREKCLAAGMDAYIAKPIDAERLIELVESFLPRAEKSEPDREQNPATSPPQRTAAQTAGDEILANFNATLSRLGGDRNLLDDMIQFFREDAPDLLEEIRQGLEAGDAEVVRRASHSLKGLAANFEATRTEEAAGKVETDAEQGDLNAANTSFDALQREVQSLLSWMETQLGSS